MPVVKGLVTAEDAGRAVSAGADGHCSVKPRRPCDRHGDPRHRSPPRDRGSDRGGLPILLDGGVRRGTDVIKAIALGASAVLIGRPYLYALAVEGAEGVRKCIDLLHREIEMAMAACGRPNVASIDRSLVKL